jgi:hypothetical protein
VQKAVDQFELRSVTRRFMTYQAIADKFRSEENSFSRTLQAALEPQVTNFLEREFASWQTSVVRNELQAVSIDVEKHLQEEAAGYRRVLREIEERLGIGGGELQIDDLVKRWLSGGSTSQGPGGVQLPDIGGGLMGDMGLLIGGIIAEVAIDIAHQAASHVVLAWVPVVGWLIAAGRIIWREAYIRQQLNENPPSWVTDEAKWEKAKEAAKKSDCDDYYACVTAIEENMGGAI